MAIIKTILPSSFNYQEPISRLVDVHSRGVDSAWMRKSAAAGVFKDAAIRPEKGYAYVHLIAMGDMETWGCNRNADGFKKCGGWIDVPHPEKGKPSRIKIAVGNQETYRTFETHAKVYRDHDHDSVKKAKGDVAKAAHNDVMDRVELIVRLPESEWRPELTKLANGEDVAWSMSTRVPFDVCMDCGRKAASRKDYCREMRNQAGTVTKDGHFIGVVNDHMTYFDISKVTVPADRIAFGLMKVASAHEQPGMTGADLAEHFGIRIPRDLQLPLDELVLGSRTTRKLAMLAKLSEIEKKIDAVAKGQDNQDTCRLAQAFDPEVQQELPDDVVQGCQDSPREDLFNILGEFADAKICLSMRDFMRLLMGKRFGAVEPELPQACARLPGVFDDMRHDCAAEAGNDEIELGTGVVPGKIRDAIQQLVPGMSLADEPVQRRMTIMVMRGKTPPKMRDSAVKLSSAQCMADRMAKAYAQYKLAFCLRQTDDIIERAVIGNFLQ